MPHRGPASAHAAPVPRLPGSCSVLLGSLALSLALAAAAAAKSRTTIPVPGGRLTVTQRGAATVLAYAARGQSRRAVLPAGSGIYPHALYSVSLVGAVPGRMLILSTEYLFRPGSPSHQCGGGTETVLRVVSLRPALRQTFAERVDSCWDSTDSRRIEWAASAHTLLIDRDEVGGAKEGHTVKTYAVQADGTVRLRSSVSVSD